MGKYQNIRNSSGITPNIQPGAQADLYKHQKTSHQGGYSNVGGAKKHDGNTTRILKPGTSNSGVLCRHHQPDDREIDIFQASDVIHQPPPQQGGVQQGTEYSSEKPTRIVQERKGGGRHLQEIISLCQRWLNQKQERHTRNKIDKRGTGPPPHLVEHSILLEPRDRNP